MKTSWIAAAALLALAGCQKKEEKVDNVATRYTESLQQDTVKAHAAADKADAAVADQNARMKEAQNLGE